MGWANCNLQPGLGLVCVYVGAALCRPFSFWSRGIRRSRHVRVQKPFVRRISRRIAISIGRITCRTLPRKFLRRGDCAYCQTAAEATPLCEGNGALRGKTASRRRRASIVVNPKNNFARPRVILDVLRCRDAHSVSFIHRNPRAIHSHRDILRLRSHPSNFSNIRDNSPAAGHPLRCPEK